ncbi:hypothetical protein [Cohnella yongneupensis]|uniref:Phasin domain-containing protein n=1 Tax=Cohnella yongneupensis TaxID=425006 RepID=A0ABW0QZJ1_9BACL
MSIKEDLAALSGLVREEAIIFAEKCRTAAIGGAQSISSNLRESAEELLPQSSIITDKLKAALQGGAAVASEQIMAAGLEFVQALKAAKTKDPETKDPE